ncbi:MULTISPECIES: hypothetical protein [unclassified Sphingomonas]|uniref:hypothetical protein n=1 Tax=unclassified Sphingomonas TaxID=196159 RepID=UPI000B0D9D45|nr:MULTISPECIES: hypothetical protein [unclassified Sphingomonas]
MVVLTGLACLMALGSVNISDDAMASRRSEHAGHVSEKDASSPPRSGTPPKRLPDSGGRTFETLDAYLEHLRTHAAPIDRPWYREVRPGVYQLETGNFRPLAGGGKPRLFTRAELMRRFGFTR